MGNIFAEDYQRQQKAQVAVPVAEDNIFARDAATPDPVTSASNQQVLEQNTLMGGSPTDPETGEPATAGERVKDIGRGVAWAIGGIPSLAIQGYNEYLAPNENAKIGINLEDFVSPPKYMGGKMLEFMGLGGAAAKTGMAAAGRLGATKVGRVTHAEQQADAMVNAIGIEKALAQGHLPYAKAYNIKSIDQGLKKVEDLAVKARAAAGQHSLLEAGDYFKWAREELAWLDIPKTMKKELVEKYGKGMVKGMTVKDQQVLLRRIRDKLDDVQKIKAPDSKDLAMKRFFVEAKIRLESMDLVAGASDEALVAYQRMTGLRRELGELERIRDGVLNNINTEVRLATGGEKTPVEAVKVLKTWEQRLSPERIKTALGPKQWRAYQHVKYALEQMARKNLKEAPSGMKTWLGRLGLGGGAGGMAYLGAKYGGSGQNQAHGPRMATTVKSSEYGSR